MEDISIAISNQNRIFYDTEMNKNINNHDKLKEQIRNYLVPSQLYLWANPKTITYKYYVDLINFIFEHCKKTTKTNLLSKLYKITSMKLSEIKEIIYSKLPEKYQSPDYIKIFNNESYDYYDIFNSDEIKVLLHKIPFMISNDWKIIKAGSKQLYKNCPDPFKMIDDKIIIEENIYNNYKNHRTNLITHYGKIKDNTIFLTTYQDIIKIIDEKELSKELKNNLIKFYFPTLKTNEIKKQTKNEYIEIDYKQKLRNQYDLIYYSDLTKQVNKLISKNTCKVKSLVFQINEETNIGDINLEYIFNNYTTEQYFPIVRYFKNHKDVLNKIYKPFIKD